MASYVIFTDSGCDISPDKLKLWSVGYAELSFRFDGEDKVYSNSEITANEFYARMREGAVAKTSAINPDAFAAEFESVLKEGKDLLYLGFSGGLSTTSNSARIAARTLAEKYPERKIIIIDTLCASAGQGMLVYLAAQKRDGGASIEENEKYIRDLLPHVCHWFTVDDLVYLKRGRRISPAAAFFGNMLGIKPVLHVDDEGHLVAVSKVRGRKTAIEALAAKYTELAESLDGPVFVSHADCQRDVDTLNEIITARRGRGIDIIENVGTVIGAHSGPGTLALFFIGKNR